MRVHLRSGTFVLLLFLAFSIVEATFVEAQQLSFTLNSHSGEEIKVARGKAPVTVVCFLGVECPMVKGYASHLSELQTRYLGEGVQFLGVDSNRQDSWEEIEEFCRGHKLTFPFVKDPGNKVADRYGAQRTPEVFVLDQELVLRYHGRIDDQYAPGVVKSHPSREDLVLAIDQLLAGKPIAVRDTTALGCIIGREKNMAIERIEDNPITFYEHVIPVLDRNCIECHRAGEIGPFAMNRFEEVVGWADTMLETIENGRMPPWHADPRFGRFANERHMSESDKQVFRDWISGGYKAGESSAIKTVAKSSESSWQLSRPPDLILPMRDRPFLVPADGVVEYQYFVVDPQLSSDRWIEAAQVLPGANSVVHHAIVFVRPPDGSVFRGVGWLTGYVPGQRLSPPLPEHARKLPANSKLVFQMHYTPNGDATEDTTQVGIWFADEKQVTHEIYTQMGIEQEFEIPPNTAKFVVKANVPDIPEGGKLLGITPHMHVRGKSFTLFGRTNSDKEEIQLQVPNYDFNWQHTYQLLEPKSAEELSGLRFEMTFDNSDQNPFNPDPSHWVTWGDQTWEEMAVAFFEVSVPLAASTAASNRNYASNTEPSDEGLNEMQQRELDEFVSRVMKNLDSNGDGVIRENETDIVVRKWYLYVWDQDGDHVITRDEIERVGRRKYN
ncbi:MAG: redoxin domain-containing protein [Planctomycetales bacterium]|nr:redoxin domain-containing protein [Planctomycetales bacterium]